MEVAFWVWIGVIVASVIVEAITMELVTCWFAVGAVIPLILSATRAVGWEIQLIIFIVISACLILFLRKITKKWLFRNKESKTNMDLVIGMKVRMLQKTDFETLGRVKINDVEWTAVADDGSEINKGDLVEVVAISGNKLKVKKISSGNTEEKKDTK